MAQRLLQLAKIHWRPLLAACFSLLVLCGGLAVAINSQNTESILEPVDASETTSPTSSPTQTSPIPSPSLKPLQAEQSIPILMYHYIRNNPDPTDHIGTGLSVSPTVFEKQLAELKAAGYTTVTFNSLKNGSPEKPIILTFDDGYDDAYGNALPTLRKQGMTGVFYIVSNFIDKPYYVTSSQVRELHAAGMEIGSHTINHRDLSKMGENEQRQQLTESKQKLEALIGQPVDSFCYPAGRYNQTTVQLAKEVGYTTSTTTKPGIAKGRDLTDSPHELRRIRVTDQTDILKELGAK